MQPIIFAFSFNKETQQLTFASNIRPTKAAPGIALKILQKVVIAQMVQGSRNDRSRIKPKAKNKSGK